MTKFRLVELTQLFSQFTAPAPPKMFYFVVMNDYTNILTSQHKDLMSNVL